MNKRNASQRIRENLHLKLRWEGQDREEVRNYSREKMDLWKKEKGYAPNFPVNKIPGYLETMERMRLEGRSYTDIGATFGLSGEAVRKHFRNYHLKTGRFGREGVYRDWDEKEFYFFPASIRRKEEISRERRAEIKERKIKEKQDLQLEAGRKFKESRGRYPEVAELSMLGINYIVIGHAWGYSPGRVSYSEAMDRFYAAMGAKERRSQGRVSKDGSSPMKKLSLDSKVEGTFVRQQSFQSPVQ